MFTYLFGPVAGTAITSEPALFAILVVFGVGLLISLLSLLVSRRLKESNPLASKQIGRLGQALLWVSVSALVVCGFFYEGAIFTRRFWPYVMLLALYGVILYTMYFYFTRYPALEAAQDAERQRRKRYIPVPQTLATPRAATTGRPSGQGESNRRRKRKSRR